MKKYVYSLVGNIGYFERFLQPQTPEQVAQKVSQAIADPTALDGNRCFSICVWALPDGIAHPKNVPKDSLADGYYMQCAGSNTGMTIEVRVPDPGNQTAQYPYIHYVIAREPVADKERFVPLTWQRDGELFTIRIHPEEVFTGEQAGHIFTDYITKGSIPSESVLRKIDI